MSKLSNLIFNGEENYLTSPFGMRTLNGKPNNHTGADYGTNKKKIPQYAIENGYVFAAQKANDGANYVWVIYPRIKKAFLHYHLDSYSIKSGQAVSKGTLLGYTGATGNATGVHLHLGIRDLSKISDNQINNINWAVLQSCQYIDPEVYAKTYIYNSNPYKFTEPKKYINRGDVGESVKWVQWELVRLGYNIGKGVNGEKDNIDGHCGPTTTQAIKDFQKQHKDQYGRQLVADGKSGPLTRWAMQNA